MDGTEAAAWHQLTEAAHRQTVILRSARADAMLRVAARILWLFPIPGSPLERITEDHEHDHRNRSRIPPPSGRASLDPHPTRDCSHLLMN